MAEEALEIKVGDRAYVLTRRGSILAFECEGVGKHRFVGCDDCDEFAERFGKIDYELSRSRSRRSSPSSYGDEVTPAKAYRLACKSATYWRRFPLPFIIDAGTNKKRPEYVPALGICPSEGAKPEELEELDVAISDVLLLGARGLVYPSRYGTNNSWAWRNFDPEMEEYAEILLKGPAGWDKAIRAALAWWEAKKPVAS